MGFLYDVIVLDDDLPSFSFLVIPFSRLSVLYLLFLENGKDSLSVQENERVLPTH